MAKKKTTGQRSTKKSTKRKASNAAKTSTGKKATKKQVASKRVTATDLDKIGDKLQKLLTKPNSKKKVMQLLMSLTEQQRRKLSPLCQKNFRAIIAVWRWPDETSVAKILIARDPKMIPAIVDLLLEADRSWLLVRYFVREKWCPKPDHPRYYTGMISALAPKWKSKQTVVSKLLKDPDLLKDDIWKLFQYEGEGDRTLANVDRFDAANWSGALLKLSKKGKLSRNKLLDSSLGALELGFNHYRARWFFDFFDLLKPTNTELKKRATRIIGLIDNPAPNVAQWAFDKQTLLLKHGLLKDPHKVIQASAPLLGARAKKTVVQVLKLFGDLVANSPKVGPEVCLAVTEALAHDKADVQKKALKLIKAHAFPDDPSLRSAVQKYSAVAAPTVKKEILAWLDTSGLDEDSATRSKPTKTSTTKSPFKSTDLKKLDAKLVERMKLPSLIASSDQGPKPDAPIPATAFQGTEIPRLDPAKSIAPIADFEELIETLGQVIEDGNLPDQAERGIAGLARLHGDKPADFDERIAPLFKRAKKLLEQNSPFSGYGYIGDVCCLICAWVRGEPVTTELRKDQWSKDRLYVIGVLDEALCTWRFEDEPVPFMNMRLLRLCQRLNEGKPILWLSQPTHAGGWICAKTLVQRVNSAKEEPDKFDLILALLRLAPDERETALKKINTKVKGEWINAIKHGLGASGIRIGKSAPLWAAAARCRSPHEDDAKVAKAFPKLGPGTASVAKFSHQYLLGRHSDVQIQTQPPLKIGMQNDLPTRLFLVDRFSRKTIGFHDTGITSGSIHWLSTMWPLGHESFFASGAARLGENLDWWEASWWNRCYLEPLLDTNVPLQPMGQLMLMCGLAAKEPGEHGLATDIAILSIEDGRLGTDNLSSMLADAFGSHFFNQTRVAKRLTDIAAASELHAYVVMLACELAIGNGSAGAGKLPRGFGDILELMVETGTRLDRPIANDDCRKFLGALKGSSKSAKAAKRLNALTGEYDPSKVIGESISNRMAKIRQWETV